MDSNQFDALSRSLATVGTRRAVTRLLGTLPLVGVLVTTVAGEPADATRHHSRKRHQDHNHDRHRLDGHQHAHAQKKHGKKHRKHKKRQPASPSPLSPASPPSPLSPPPDAGCKPESAALTCAGRCGQVRNNCDTMVDCGSCACAAACPVCQTCNTTTGHCDTNPAFLGLVCAAPGQICQADGTCICASDSCPFGQRCNGLACICDEASCSRPGHFCLPDGTCSCDSESCPAGQRCKRSVCVCDETSCPHGCCDEDGNCQVGNDDGACGTDGDACQSCTSLGQRCGGGGTPAVCGCASDATTCAGKCGMVENNCGQSINCTLLCAGCCANDGSCQLGTDAGACGAGGEPCFTCDAPDTCFEAACCTQTTCSALSDPCEISGDCPYGICGIIPDTCGGLDCGQCADGHPCFTCENNICVRLPGSVVCGASCCFSGCCVTPGTGLCGAETCISGQCCPIGYDCCNATDGSGRSSCYNLSTQCNGALFCCPAGNTCCSDSSCCTSNTDCLGGKQCRSGCCRF